MSSATGSSPGMSSPGPDPQAGQPVTAPGSAEASSRAFAGQADRGSAAGQEPRESGGAGGAAGLAGQAAGTAEKAVSAAMAPVAAAARVLPTKGGLPLYAGLGGLALVGVLEWPVAVAAGAGYGLARLLNRPDGPRQPAGSGDTTQYQPTAPYQPGESAGPSHPAS